MGRPADVIRLRTDDARFTPALSDAELLGHLVWAGAGYLVTDVWVGGTQVVEHGPCTTVDGDRARAEVGSAPADCSRRRARKPLGRHAVESRASVRTAPRRCMEQLVIMLSQVFQN